MMNYTIQSLQDYIATLYPDDLKAGKRLLIKSAAYSINALSLAAAATSTQVVNMQANADFLCMGLSHRANIAGAATTVTSKAEPLIRILITDTGSNEQWTNQAVDISTYSSNDAKMRPLPYPRFVGGRAQLNVQLTSYEAANTNVLDLVFHGVNIFVLG